MKIGQQRVDRVELVAGTNEQICVAIERLESSLGRGGFERPDDSGAHSYDSAMRFLDCVEGPAGGRGEMAPFLMHDVVVELLDGNGSPIPGFTAADCASLCGDHRAGGVSWTGGTQAPAGTKQAKITLKRAFLYGFEFCS